MPHSAEHFLGTRCTLGTSHGVCSLKKGQPALCWVITAPQFSEATGFPARTPTRLRERSRSPHTHQLCWHYQGSTLFSGKMRPWDRARSLSFRKGRVHRITERGTGPSRRGSPHAAAAAPDTFPSARRARWEARPVGGPPPSTGGAAGRAQRPTFRGKPRGAAPRPQLRQAPAPRGGVEVLPPLRHGASPQPRPGAAGAALRSHRAEDTAERRSPRPRPARDAERRRLDARGLAAAFAAAPAPPAPRSPQAAPERPQHGGALTAPHKGSPRPSPAPRRPARRTSIRSMDAPLSLSLSPLRARHSLERSLDRAGSRGWQPAVRLATGGRSAAAAAAPLFAAALTAAGGAARARAGLPLSTRPRGGGSASCPRPAPLLPLSYRGQRSAAAEVQAADPETHRRPRPAGLRREANRRAGGGRGAGPGWSGLSGAGPVGAGRGGMMRRRSAAPRKAREREGSEWRGWGWAPAVRRAARGLRCAGRGGRPCGGLLCVPPRWRRRGPRGVWARGSLRGRGAAVSAQREAPARLGANVAPRADRC